MRASDAAFCCLGDSQNSVFAPNPSWEFFRSRTAHPIMREREREEYLSVFGLLLRAR